ncbi:MAG TPA: fibronectin type III domain-containing protein [Candidatus Eremiobacteraceae bacterium]|jgi:hypothetical protein
MMNDRPLLRMMVCTFAMPAIIAGMMTMLVTARAGADWTPTPGPVPAPNSFRITRSPWHLTPDGTWTALLHGHFADAQGADLPLVHAEVNWSTSAGVAQGQVRWTYSDPAALVTLVESSAVTVTAKPVNPPNRTVTLQLVAPAADVASFACVARAIGPRLVNIGWTPLDIGVGVVAYKVYRRESHAMHGRLVASLTANAHAYHDDGVWPGRHYRYAVVALRAAGAPMHARSNAVELTADMPVTSVGSISGKGMFLFFTPDAADPEHGYPSYDTNSVIATAVAAGIRDIELRLAYGSFFQASNPGARAWLDGFIDASAAAGIRLLAWEVPRQATTSDIAEAIAIARYRTPSGNGFGGLALDIENGDDYMGDGDAAKQAMVDYIHQVRQAVGNKYLVVATIISPRLTHWTNAEYPYARIAPYASVLQPMEYWHYFYSTSHHVYSEAGVSSAIAGAVALTKQLAGRDVPVNVAGQSDDLGGTGVPTPDEIGWSLAAAKDAGAIGEMFFDWRGTPPNRWPAIGAYPW